MRPLSLANLPLETSLQLPPSRFDSKLGLWILPPLLRDSNHNHRLILKIIVIVVGPVTPNLLSREDNTLPLHLLDIALPHIDNPTIEVNMRVHKPTKLPFKLNPLDPLKAIDFAHDLIGKMVRLGARILHLPRELINTQLQLTLTITARLLMIDPPDVLNLGADEPAGTTKPEGSRAKPGHAAAITVTAVGAAATAAARGGQHVAIGGALVEVLGQLLVVELFLLAGFEEILERAAVGDHVTEGAEVVLVGVVFELFETPCGVFDGGGEGVHGGFNAWFESDELLELLREVFEVCFEVSLAAGYPGDYFFDVIEVLVELVALFFDFDEAPVRFVNLGEGVHKAVCEAVKYAAPTSLVPLGPNVYACACWSKRAPCGSSTHGGVPVRTLKKSVKYARTAEDGMERQP